MAKFEEKLGIERRKISVTKSNPFSHENPERMRGIDNSIARQP
jgi:hypothetical protein